MEKEFIKFHLHSFVSLITNSSTVIFMYQDSIHQTKELVKEVLKLSGEDKDPNDIFYYGVFCDNDRYLDNIPNELDLNPRDYKASEELLESLKIQIMKGEIEQPDWMSEAEDDSDWWAPSRYLYLIPKEEKYKELGQKIRALLNSVNADGGRDG